MTFILGIAAAHAAVQALAVLGIKAGPKTVIANAMIAIWVERFRIASTPGEAGRT